MAGSFLIIILLISIATLVICQSDDIPYEPGENACSRCNCTEKETTPPSIAFLLNCTNRDLTQILSSYDNILGVNHTGKIIDMSFSGNAIKHLKQFPSTEATVFFSCRHCQLQEIASAAFIDVPNILILDLSYNSLTGDALTPDIFRGRYNEQQYEPINLRHIDLSHNLIKHLDSQVFEHTKYLSRLSLAHNILNISNSHTISALISLSNIDHLDLSNNSLTDLPDELFNNTMTKLRTLILENNKFITVPESIGLLGETLRSMYIGNNLIQELNDESFLGMKKLTHLNIDKMLVMKKIQAGTFRSLVSLETLSCCHNKQLREFDLSSLSAATNLKNLHLFNCSLTSLDIIIPTAASGNDSEATLFKTTKLKTLKLGNNPWHCDCSLFKAMDNLKHLNEDIIKEAGDPRCSTPYELNSDLLTELKTDKMCSITNTKKPSRIPPYEPPPFLRPRSIMLSLLSVLTVIVIGLFIGLLIVNIKKRLKDGDLGFSTPIRYTTVRNSTTSAQ